MRAIDTQRICTSLLEEGLAMADLDMRAESTFVMDGVSFGYEDYRWIEVNE